MIKVEIMGGDFKGYIGELMLHPLRGYVVYILTLGEDFDFEAEDLKLVPPDTALSEE